MPPPAPPLFSTTTLRPSFSAKCAASGRAAMSAVPPGGNGTTTVMVRLGHTPCACAPLVAPWAKGSAAVNLSNSRRLTMAFPLCRDFKTGASHRVRVLRMHGAPDPLGRRRHLDVPHTELCERIH